jgi:hypothetical protein
MMKVAPDMKIFEVEQTSREVDYSYFIESLLGEPFLILHELLHSKTYLGIRTGLKGIVENANPGLILNERAKKIPRSMRYLSAYPLDLSLRRGDNENVELNRSSMSSLYKLFRDSESEIYVVFYPPDAKEVISLKNRMEDKLSSIEIRATKERHGRGGIFPWISSQLDLYYKSDEKKSAYGILNTLNDIILSNFISYKVGIYILSEDNHILSYIKSKVCIVADKEVIVDDIGTLFTETGKLDGIPVSPYSASRLLTFSEYGKKVDIINAGKRISPGEVILGQFLEDSYKDTELCVGVGIQSLNLGTLIVGLPGTGKTLCTMNIISQIKKKSKVVIISPTEEWSYFGDQNNMKVVRLYEDNVQINFFKCDSLINIERFYENLAMLIASASNAGPYKNSLEKCLIAAFSNIYNKTRTPDPVDVYLEIENEIVRRHAVSNNSGIRYTKHGENIMAALEDLRLMLLKREFAYEKGINFRELIERGVVFDLSSISNKMKPFFYALILGQIYSLADEFNTNGDNELRMLICLEEAQLVFGGEEVSTAAADLKSRIQDFRKKGIGLLMITHSITEITIDIRRLFQIKMYFRQSPDSAKTGINDLTFMEEERESVYSKLKILDNKTCVLNYVNKTINGTELYEPIFIRVPEYNLNNSERPSKLNEQKEQRSDTIILLGNKEHGKPLKITIKYVGREIYHAELTNENKIVVEDLLPDKRYELIVNKERKKDTKKFTIIGGQFNTIMI